MTPGANVIMLPAVIYHHSMAILSFCVIKLYYLGNYHGMAVNYCGILTLEKIGLKLPQQFTIVLLYNILAKFTSSLCELDRLIAMKNYFYNYEMNWCSIRSE